MVSKFSGVVRWLCWVFMPVTKVAYQRYRLYFHAIFETPLQNLRSKEIPDLVLIDALIALTAKEKLPFFSKAFHVSAVQ